MRLKALFNNSARNSQDYQPLIIAEAGVNHEGDIDLARRLIDEAAEGGADAIKFQTYKAETLATIDSPAYWDLNEEPTDSQFKLFKKYDKFWKKDYETLKYHCDSVDIEFISTPFDLESAHFLNDLMDVFKISSSDIMNKPFIKAICKYGKPILLSTGASYLLEIKTAVDWINNAGNQVALLHCVLNYPTEDKNANLLGIRTLKNNFPSNIIGYSDHTLPGDMKNIEIATLLGAKIIEKHFTYDKTLLGNDHYHSMDKIDLKRLHDRLSILGLILGDGSFDEMSIQNKARDHARRSLVLTRDLVKGDTIKLNDLTWKRPGLGISPKDIDAVVGSTISNDLKEDTVLTWEFVNNNPKKKK
jgi:sialic acid synthase SpsE